jgi:hypothetical protein
MVEIDLLPNSSLRDEAICVLDVFSKSIVDEELDLDQEIDLATDGIEWHLSCFRDEFHVHLWEGLKVKKAALFQAIDPINESTTATLPAALEETLLKMCYDITWRFVLRRVLNCYADRKTNSKKPASRKRVRIAQGRKPKKPRSARENRSKRVTELCEPATVPETSILASHYQSHPFKSAAEAIERFRMGGRMLCPVMIAQSWRPKTDFPKSCHGHGFSRIEDIGYYSWNVFWDQLLTHTPENKSERSILRLSH